MREYSSLVQPKVHAAYRARFNASTYNTSKVQYKVCIQCMTDQSVRPWCNLAALFVCSGTVASRGSVAMGRERHMRHLIRSRNGRGAASPEGEQGSKPIKERQKSPHWPAQIQAERSSTLQIRGTHCTAENFRGEPRTPPASPKKNPRPGGSGTKTVHGRQCHDRALHPKGSRPARSYMR